MIALNASGSIRSGQNVNRWRILKKAGIAFPYDSRRTGWFTPMSIQVKSRVSPGIECRAGVIGGDPCIAGTRIPVWLLVTARKTGSNEADLLKAYPLLRAQDLRNAWAFYSSNRVEIDQQIAENEVE